MMVQRRDGATVQWFDVSFTNEGALPMNSPFEGGQGDV